MTPEPRSGSSRRFVVAGTLAVLCALATGCRSSETDAPGKVRVFVAASAAAAFEKFVAGYGAENVDVVVNAASSSALARQIEAGAPADLFLSADSRWIRRLQGRGLVDADFSRVLFGNELVVARGVGIRLSVEIDPSFDIDSAFMGCIAMGDPASVPVGIYGKQVLERLGWWNEIRGRVVGAANAVAAANLVARGECPVGILYASDVRAYDGIATAARIPAGLSEPIEYVIVPATGASPASSELLDALSSERARRIFADFGFTNIDGTLRAD
jgi:molybdate transport system substrate-binding protein